MKKQKQKKKLTRPNWTHLQTKFATSFNSLPNDKILDRSKYKAFADSKKNVAQKLKMFMER